MIPRFTVYGRDQCHLCQDLQEQLADLAPLHGFSFDIVDIDADPELVSRFGHKVPVLMAGDDEICHYVLDAGALLTYLKNKTA